jgi:hypothetical protein
MKAAEFKTGIKQLKSNLRGLTLQLINSNSTRPYFTLNEFGTAILNEEKNGNSFTISQAWTSQGIVKISSIKELAQLFVTNTITGIQFKAYNEHQTTNEYYGSLD